MTLAGSGQLSFSQIRIELDQGGTGQSETSMNLAYNGYYGTLGLVQRCQSPYPTAYAVSSWYGYNHAIRATARTGSPFALVPTDTSCDTACDTGFSLTFDTSAYQFSGGTIWYLDNGCNDFLPAGKYMATGREFCHTINGSGIRTELWGCTTTTTTAPTTTTTAAPCSADGVACSEPDGADAACCNGFCCGGTCTSFSC